MPLAQPRRCRALSGRLARGVAREAAWFPHGVRRRARRDGVDLLHLTAALGVPVGRLPVVMTVHDTYGWERPGWVSPPIRLQHRLRVGPGLRRVAAVVVPSRYTAERLVDTLDVDPGKVHVTPYGVGPPFSPGDPMDAVLGDLGIRRP